MDHDKLLPVTVFDDQIDQLMTYLPCHYHNQYGQRITSFEKLLSDIVVEAAAASSNQQQECAAVEEDGILFLVAADQAASSPRFLSMPYRPVGCSCSHHSVLVKLYL